MAQDVSKPESIVVLHDMLVTTVRRSGAGLTLEITFAGTDESLPWIAEPLLRVLEQGTRVEVAVTLREKR